MNGINFKEDKIMKFKNIAKKTANVSLHVVAGAASASIAAIAGEAVYSDISLKMHPLHVTSKGFGPWKKTVITRPGAKSILPINPSVAKTVTASSAVVGGVSGGVYGAQLNKALETIDLVDMRPTYYYEVGDDGTPLDFTNFNNDDEVNEDDDA
jgi:hypothetical protein